MRNDAANPSRTSRHHRHARGKRLEYRTRHVVDVGTVEKDMRLVVELVHLVGRYTSAEFDVLQLQLTRERLEHRPLTAVAHDDQPCLRKPLLDLRKRSQNARDVVQRIEIAVRQEDRPQWFPFAKLETARVNHV